MDETPLASIREAVELWEASRAAMDWVQAAAAIDAEIISTLGLRSVLGGFTKAPFDTLGDTLRGTRGIMLDIYMHPSKLLGGVGDARAVDGGNGCVEWTRWQVQPAHPTKRGNWPDASAAVSPGGRHGGRLRGRGRGGAFADRLLNRAFLVAAMTAGLDAVILDPLDAGLMALLRAAEAVLGRDQYCARYLRAYREGRLAQG